MSSHHWAHIGERGTLLGMLIMVRIRRVLGHWPFRLVLRPVITWYFLRHGLARRASLRYLQRLDPDAERSKPARWRQSLAHFMTFGETMMDKVTAWSGEQHAPIDGRGVANMERAVRGGRGGLILVAHHGNLDIVNALGNQHDDFGLTILMHRHNARKFNRLLERATGQPRPDVLEVTDMTPGTAQILDARIRAGGFVVIAADRVPLNDGRTRSLEFLGESAPFPEGPFHLATLLRCPVYTLSCVRDGDGFQADFEPFDDTTGLPRREREAWIDTAMQRHADHLAARVRRYPLQWFNFFPFWHDDTDTPS